LIIRLHTIIYAVKMVVQDKYKCEAHNVTSKSVNIVGVLCKNLSFQTALKDIMDVDTELYAAKRTTLQHINHRQVCLIDMCY